MASYMDYGSGHGGLFFSNYSSGLGGLGNHLGNMAKTEYLMDMSVCKR